ncbi:DUF3017 domain-containing protein [Nocardioides terrisoli]|uniref:DUF3017 domain-containing protein n=1 Tax=Nocardioides terrisoli TaxID=3388267 RepID=UPI00287B88B9|nr:DUF3017 domain-containing protein [Nocardioides marmorisolisilvae]
MPAQPDPAQPDPAQPDPAQPAPGTPVPGVPGPVPEPAPRRRPSTWGGAVYLAVLAICLAGLGVVAFGPWRNGVVVVGAGLLLGAVARLVLSDLNGGMLRVRSKWFDVAALAAVGVLAIILAVNIPNQPR